LQKTQERGLGPIRKKIQLMIQDLSRVRGIDLVLSSSNAVYHSPKIDLTAEIISSLDN
jgi:Skp family chaperone for outer membrane proteins